MVCPIVPVFVSRKILDRRKDSFVSANWKRYKTEVDKILLGARTSGGPVEIIGPFVVSPTGQSRKGIRVAWHAERFDGKTIFMIDDFLYHENENRYVDNWNRRATEGVITRDFYKNAGFLSPEELKALLDIDSVRRN